MLLPSLKKIAQLFLNSHPSFLSLLLIKKEFIVFFNDDITLFCSGGKFFLFDCKPFSVLALQNSKRTFIAIDDKVHFLLLSIAHLKALGHTIFTRPKILIDRLFSRF